APGQRGGGVLGAPARPVLADPGGHGDLRAALRLPPLPPAHERVVSRIFANPWVRLLLLVGTLALVWLVLQRLAGVLTPFAVAFALAWLLNPAVNALEGRLSGRAALARRMEPRAAAVGLLAVVLVLVLVGGLLLVVPALVHQIAEAVAKVPAYAQEL